MEEKKDPLGEEETHESYGMIGVHRISGGDANLFGSAIKHNERVMVRIVRGSKRRSLHQDWYYGSQRDLIEVEMSPVQFSEMLFSLNHGSGVPCTIRYFGGKEMERCPETNVREIYEDEFEGAMSRISKRISRLALLARQKLRGKGTLKRPEREEIAGAIEQLVQDVRSNLPFIATQFNETMDKIVLAAKGEADAFLTRTITEAGLDKLRAEGLLEGKPRRKLRLKRGSEDGKVS